MSSTLLNGDERISSFQHCSFRDAASFGRRHEYIAAAELLKRGFDVYMTLVDDQGIDCVIRLSRKHYVDVQIKARSVKAKQPTFFAAMKFRPRDNLWFIFFTETSGHYWVMPSRRGSSKSPE